MAMPWEKDEIILASVGRKPWDEDEIIEAKATATGQASGLRTKPQEQTPRPTWRDIAYSRQIESLPETTLGEKTIKTGLRVLGVTGLPSRALGALRGMDVTDSESNILRPEIQGIKSKIQGDGVLAKIGRGTVDFVGSAISDPTTYMGAGVIRGVASKALMTPTQKIAAQVARNEALIRKGGAELIERKAQNLAAKRINMPLTRGEAAAKVGVPVKNATGVWATVERNIRSLPGAQNVYAKLNEERAKSVVNAIEGVYGPISTLEDDLAGEVEKNLSRVLRTKKDEFANLYGEMLEQGKTAYVDGERLAVKIGRKLENSRDLNYIPENEKARILSYVDKIKGISTKVQEGGGIAIERKAGESPLVELGYRAGMDKRVLGPLGHEVGPQITGNNYEAFKNLISMVGSEKRRMMDKLAVSSSGMTDKQASQAAKIYGGIYDTMKAAEYNHLKIIGGPDLASKMKTIDRAYADDIGPMNIVKRMFGIGRDAGEKGGKESQAALMQLVNPVNQKRLDAALKIMDNESKNSIARALMGKIIKDSSVLVPTSDGTLQMTNFFAGRFRSNMQKYRPVMKKLLNEKQSKTLDDLSISMNRANIDKLNLLDPSNPSGSGAKVAITNMITQMIGGAGLGFGTNVSGGNRGFDDAVYGALATIGLAGGTRTLAKIATRTPMSGYEKGLAAIGALGAGYGISKMAGEN